MLPGPRPPIPPAPPGRAGIGWRGPHHAGLLASRPPVGWLEVHPENYMGGGAPLHYLMQARELWPLSLHGVGLGLAGVNPPDAEHLAHLARLAALTEPFLVSEHLAWVSMDGQYFNDLLPAPYDEESLQLMCRNISITQDALRRQILIENPATYLRYRSSVMPEAEFLQALVHRTGCGLLCDVNNVYVSSFNHAGPEAAEAVAEAYIDSLPTNAVYEIHLAGHTENDADGEPILIDSHDGVVANPVWRLYHRAVRRFPGAVTLIEWDTDLPPLEALVEEAALADRHRAGALETEPQDAA